MPAPFLFYSFALVSLPISRELESILKKPLKMKQVAMAIGSMWQWPTRSPKLRCVYIRGLRYFLCTICHFLLISTRLFGVNIVNHSISPSWVSLDSCSSRICVAFCSFTISTWRGLVSMWFRMATTVVSLSYACS